MTPSPFTLLITDLDNTLFDWFAHWLAGFSVLVAAAQRDSGASREDVLQAVRAVHQRHGTSEYAFLPYELPSELPVLRWSEPRAAEVAREVERARRACLELYPGVMPTLVTLKERGVTLVGYTESMAVYTARRVKALHLDGVLDAVYSPRGYDVPRDLSPDAVQFYKEGWSVLDSTSHRYTPMGQIKPAPDVLKSILSEFDTAASQAVYVGDSLMKDIAMAQAVGTADAYARYRIPSNNKVDFFYLILASVVLAGLAVIMESGWYIPIFLLLGGWILWVRAIIRSPEAEHVHRPASDGASPQG